MINRIRYWWHEYRGTHLWPWSYHSDDDPYLTDVNTKCRCGIALQDYVGKHR